MLAKLLNSPFLSFSSAMPCKTHSISVVDIYRANRRNIFSVIFPQGPSHCPLMATIPSSLILCGLSLHKVIVFILLNKQIRVPWSIVKLTSAIFFNSGVLHVGGHIHRGLLLVCMVFSSLKSYP